MPTAKPSRPSNLILIEDFVCAGLASLLLLGVRTLTPFTPLSLVALLPYFLRLLRADLRRSLVLGLVVGSSYPILAWGDLLLTDPVLLLYRLFLFNLVFAAYGIAVNRTRCVFGLDPRYLLLLWLPLEYATNYTLPAHLVGSLTGTPSGIEQRMANWLQLLAVPMLLVLLNPIFLLLVGAAIRRFLRRRREENAVPLRLCAASPLRPYPRSWFSFPDIRSPPLSEVRL